jgi:hypothetical protein
VRTCLGAQRQVRQNLPVYALVVWLNMGELSMVQLIPLILKQFLVSKIVIGFSSHVMYIIMNLSLTNKIAGEEMLLLRVKFINSSPPSL